MTTLDLTSLTRSARRRPIWVPEERHRFSVDRRGVEKLLRHRDPFLFVDEITELDLEGPCIRGRRRIDPEDPIFAGHFPGHPVYPGVLQVEMTGQLGICLLSFLTQGSADRSREGQSLDVRGFKVHTAEFLAPVAPGSELTLVSKALVWDELTAICAGQTLCGETVCSWAVWEVYLVDPAGGLV